MFQVWEDIKVRASGFTRRIAAKDLCAAALVIMPSLLFNPSVAGRTVQFLLFWLFAALTGRKTNPLMTLFIILCIVFFNLLVPYGRVLASFGVFKISEGALLSGVRRAVTLEGLIMLSKAGIRSDLRLPGVFGALLGESLRIFAALTAQRRRVSPKNLVADIDAILFEISAEPAPTEQSASAPRRTSAAGRAALIIAACASWAVFALGIAL